MSDKDDLLRRMALDLRNTCPNSRALAAYDAASRKPDAAERAWTRWQDSKPGTVDIVAAIREEIARDNAERDALDREREEAIRDYMANPDTSYAARRRVVRAFGWDNDPR